MIHERATIFFLLSVPLRTQSVTCDRPLRETHRALFTFGAFAQFENEEPASRLCFAARVCIALLCTEIAVDYVHFGRPSRGRRRYSRVVVFSAIWNGIFGELAEAAQQKQ